MSADVVHSFWVPQLAGKTDLIPNRVNEMWIDPLQTGVYLGQCAQFCGMQHANMLIRVYVDTPEQFAAWAQNQQQQGREEPQAALGRHIFETQSCMNCHAIQGTAATGRFGPRSHSSYEPGDDRFRHRSQQSRQSRRLDQEPRSPQKGIADAGNAARRRSN